ncbi:tripartite tricarboxylate transporter TctB family protein [Phyllobacterium phragmitis]|nr:tripartite tricarboxylate transporter TctB family protein [Phyllobacterium phragmitis]
MSDKTKTASRAGRIGGVCLLLLAVAYGIGGSRIEYAFASDPLGPRVIPVMLAIILAVLCLFHLRKPGLTEPFPTGSLLLKTLAVPAFIIVAVLLLEPLGFAVSIFVLTAGIGWIFGAPLRKALIGAAGHALLWWFVFSYLLDVYLPKGALFG